jgi:NTP pyrophosphatase (non-canonical NTP hydrolase)
MELGEMRLVVDNYVRSHWGGHDRSHSVGDHMALLHSEISEAFEEYREHRMETEILDNGKPIGFPSEIADVLIRVLDCANFYGIDLEKEFLLKMEYNKTRPMRHGGKAI